MIQKETETGLLAAAVQGNRDAYGQLVRKYQDRLMATVYRVVQDRADAEDLCQEAFLPGVHPAAARSQAAVRSILGCAVSP